MSLKCRFLCRCSCVSNSSLYLDIFLIFANQVIDTFETHPWIAANARNKKVHHAFTINNNLVYYPVMAPAPAKYAVAEIRKAPGKLCTMHARSTQKSSKIAHKKDSKYYECGIVPKQ